MTSTLSAAADLTLRPATLDEAAFVADVMTAARPDRPIDPLLQRHWWQSVDTHSHGFWERFVAVQGDRAVGFAWQQHEDWADAPVRFSRVQAELLPEARTAERLDALVAAMEVRARASGAQRLASYAFRDNARMLAVLRGRGYRDERRQRFWELDLTKNRDGLAAMTEAGRARMREQGIRLLTLADDRDPEKMTKLWRMSEEAQQDAPTTIPHAAMPLEEFLSWLRSPGLHPDRIWIARRGDGVVGVSMLEYPPVRGVVQTDWTATARSVRGQGVARALKCETVMQAIALGVDRVRTDNDGANAPILHINASMGYVVWNEMVLLVRDA